MTLFTILWIIVVSFAFIQPNMKPITFLTLLFMTFQCVNVVSAGSIHVGPQIATSFVFILKYLINSGGKIKLIKKKEFILMDFCLLALIIAVVYSTNINGLLEDKFLNIVQLIIYICCYWCMRRIIHTFSTEEIYKIVRNVILVIVVIGVVQWLTTIGVLPLRTILKYLLYNDDSLNIYFNLNDHLHNVRIYSVFMEPSYLAGFLVGAFYYLFSFQEKFKKNLKLLGIILIEILMTTSSTAYGAFALVGMLFVIYSKQISLKTKFVIVIGGILGFSIFYFGFYDILDNVIFSKASSGSGITRAGWNIKAYAAYKKSPLFGVGYKNIRGSSIFYSLLGEIGIIGFLAYISMVLCSIYKLFWGNRRKNPSHSGYYGTMYALLSVVICQFIACPDLDMCTFWFWMYALAMNEGLYFISWQRNKTHEEDVYVKAV